MGKLGPLALVPGLVLMFVAAPALAGVTISNGIFSVGIGYGGELWDPVTGVGFRRLSDGFDPLAIGIPRDSWGISLGPDGGFFADQSYAGSALISPILSKTSASTAVSYNHLGGFEAALEQRYSFVAPNILRISEIIHECDWGNYFWFQRNWDVDVAPTPFGENSFGPIGSAPHVIEVSNNGFEHPDASIPYVQNCLLGCNATGNLGGGIKIEFDALGKSKRIDYYYGISQRGQNVSDLIRQAFGVGARYIVATQSAENGGWSNTGSNSAFIAVDTEVPEPASWAMMIAGFALTGMALRQRRQRFTTSTPCMDNSPLHPSSARGRHVLPSKIDYSQGIA